MKAVVASKFSHSEKPTVKLDSNYPQPTPKPGEILVKLAYSPIQPSDFLNSQGGFPKTLFPRVLGRDFAGTVVSAANGASSPLIGKQVCGTSGATLSFTVDGAHAEFVAVPEDAVAEVAQGMDLKKASILGTPWTTAWLTLDHADAKPGEMVLVTGAGGAVGDAVCQLARSKLWGLKVLTAGRGSKYDVDSAANPDLDPVFKLTQENGVDIVIDTTGDLNLMKAAMMQLAFGGRLCVISTASHGGSTSNSMEVDFKYLYRKELSVRGCNSADQLASTGAKWLQKIKPAFESGDLKGPNADVWSEVGIDGAAEAYAEMGQGSRKKFVIGFGSN